MGRRDQRGRREALAAFGRALRTAREGRRLSVDRLAEISEIGRGSIERIERGLRDPTLAELDRLARALGLTVSALIALSEERESEL